MATSGAGKSQFYHYFSNKKELVEAVLDHQRDQVLDELNRFRIETLDDVVEWFGALVALQETEREFLGCPLGSIAAEVTEHGDVLRSRAGEAFDQWEAALADVLRGMVQRGLLRLDANADLLAQATIATLQGGYLLSSAKRDGQPMRVAVDAAFRHLRLFAARSTGDNE